MKNSRTTTKGYGRSTVAGAGHLFNLGTSPLSPEMIQQQFVEAKREVCSLPNGKAKTTIVNLLGNAYGYIVAQDWIGSAFAAPVGA